MDFSLDDVIRSHRLLVLWISFLFCFFFFCSFICCSNATASACCCYAGAFKENLFVNNFPTNCYCCCCCCTNTQCNLIQFSSDFQCLAFFSLHISIPFQLFRSFRHGSIFTKAVPFKYVLLGKYSVCGI